MHCTIRIVKHHVPTGAHFRPRCLNALKPTIRSLISSIDYHKVQCFIGVIFNAGGKLIGVDQCDLAIVQAFFRKAIAYLPNPILVALDAMDLFCSLGKPCSRRTCTELKDDEIGRYHLIEVVDGGWSHPWTIRRAGPNPRINSCRHGLPRRRRQQLTPLGMKASGPVVIPPNQFFHWLHSPYPRSWNELSLPTDESPMREVGGVFNFARATCPKPYASARASTVLPVFQLTRGSMVARLTRSMCSCAMLTSESSKLSLSRCGSRPRSSSLVCVAL